MVNAAPAHNFLTTTSVLPLGLPPVPDKDSGMIHNLDAQEEALKRNTKIAFMIWMFIMLFAFGLFVALRYV